MTVTDKLTEVEAVGDERGDAHAVVNTLADTLPEVDAKTIGDTQGVAHALVDNMANTTIWLTRYKSWRH